MALLSKQRVKYTNNQGLLNQHYGLYQLTTDSVWHCYIPYQPKDTEAKGRERKKEKGEEREEEEEEEREEGRNRRTCLPPVSQKFCTSFPKIPLFAAK